MSEFDRGHKRTRRGFIAASATACAATAGCLSFPNPMPTPNGRIIEGSDVLEVVDVDSGIFGYAATIRLKKEFEPPVSHLVCLHDGEQYAAGTIGTGSDTTEFDVPDGKSTLLAIQGGRTDRGKVIGGTVAARGTLEVTE